MKNHLYTAVFIVFVLLIVCNTVIPAQSPSSKSKERIIAQVRQFLDDMKNKQPSKIPASLYATQSSADTGISIEHLSKSKLNQLTDDLMEERLSPYKYIKAITGHNIHLFLYKTKNKKGLIEYNIKFARIEESLFDPERNLDKVLEQKLSWDKDNFYYIDVQLEYEIVQYSHDGTTVLKREKKKSYIEIDIAPVNGAYKIFGFII